MRKLAYVAAIFSTAALAQVSDLNDLVGSRAAGAEQEMLRRGWVNTGGTKGDDTAYSNWYNAGRRQCVTVATRDGRYAAITPTTLPDCRQTATTLPSRPPAYVPPSRPPQNWNPDPNYGVSPAARDLALVCYGNGSAPTARGYTTYEWSNKQGRYTPRYRNYLDQQNFNSEVQVEVIDGQARIHLSGRMKPPLNNGGLGGGWWEIRDLRIDQDTISGRYKLNGLNQPKIRIDRRSGQISINGMNAFVGTCDPVNAVRRRF